LLRRTNNYLQSTGFRAPSVLLFVALLLSAGCRHAPQHVELTSAESHPTADAILVPANQEWVDTGLELHAGESVGMTATGRVVCVPLKSAADVEQQAVGPQGTFLYSDAISDQPFPLPAAASGPAPAFALIGRIGDGPAFFVGERMNHVATRSGQLQLRVNDFNPADNGGGFEVQVTAGRPVEPIAFEQVVPLHGAAGGSPAEGCSVVVFYMDGLRPDVIREMAAMGHIPNINQLFVEGGAWTQNSFTAFPSDTITSNGTMWTGCFSDRHGIKGQVRFSRRTLQSESYLEPLGPNRSARLLAPQGVDKVLHHAQAASISATKGTAEAERWQKTAVTGVPPVYQHLRNNGGDWATGVLPMMTEMPPLLWTRSLVRHMPYLQSHEGYKYIDDANAHYATRHLLNQQQPVTIIWLPETDSISHKFSRGQFGATRRTIAMADQLIGRVVDELKAQGRFEKTYLMLVSDHGHHGGRETHLSHFDIANKLFYRPREISADGKWIGGGLGMSVRQHRSWNRHPEDSSRDFVFIDGDSDGVARVFLPRGHFHSRDWMGDFKPADMLHFHTAPNRPPINLIDSVLAIQDVHGDGTLQHPVDLVLTKLNDNSILIATVDRGYAVIDRRRNDDGKWEYKYTPVENLRPTVDGTIAYDVVNQPRVDPLGLIGHVPSQLLTYYHDEQVWLRMTTETRYPDSVVTLTRHMLWQDNLKFRETEFASDMVVTARPGWYFGNESSPGTMHGYPLADAMRATLFVSGPNVRRGARIVEPCRLADLTPTMLEMTGTPFDPEDFDGTALKTIYAPGVGREETAAIQPVFWSDVDLNAWKPLDYAPLEPYEHMPISVNRPTSPFDLNNVIYNALSVTDINVVRVADDVFSPLNGGSRPIIGNVERTDHQLRNETHPWIGEAVEVFDFPGTTIGDYSTTSLGNLKRVDRAVDWMQHRLQNTDGAIARQMGRSQLPGSKPLHNTIDAMQWGVWEIYRFAQRVVVQAVDETLINSVENGADRAINHFRSQPAEIFVETPNSIAAPSGISKPAVMEARRKVSAKR